MRYHSQNLTENYLDKKERSIFWAGRAWLYLGKRFPQNESCHWGWAFGRYARSFAATIGFGYGDSNDGICFHLCIPFLFSIYFIIDSVFRCEECRTGIAIHNEAIWIYPISYDNHWTRSDPWWRKSLSWYFPWSLDWHKTEVLSHDLSVPVWTESKGVLRDHELQFKAQESVTKEYPYRYVLRSGEVQDRVAKVYANRMEWRARWWPIIPIKKIRTSISISFNQEVGEGIDSYKGGCTGCGWEIIDGETPETALRRMEKERAFGR